MSELKEKHGLDDLGGIPGDARLPPRASPPMPSATSYDEWWRNHGVGRAKDEQERDREDAIPRGREEFGRASQRDQPADRPVKHGEQSGAQDDRYWRDEYLHACSRLYALENERKEEEARRTWSSRPMGQDAQSPGGHEGRQGDRESVAGSHAGDGAGVGERVVRKEAEKVIAPDFPSIAGVRSWVASLAHQVAAASGRANAARVVEWVKAATLRDAKMHDFDQCEPEFQSLDGKLMTAMKAMLDRAAGKAKGIVHRVEREMQNALQRNALTRGRHIVFMVVDSLRSFDNSDMYCGFDHLVTVALHGNGFCATVGARCG